jgi:hypothetical protein
MDMVLIILGILGSGAIVISIYVFTAAERNYSSKGNNRTLVDSTSGLQHQVARSATDRRKRKPVTFPLNVNGILIANDRRILTDRRTAA